MGFELIEDVETIARAPCGNGEFSGQDRAYKAEILAELQSGVEVGNAGDEGGCRDSEGNCELLS